MSLLSPNYCPACHARVDRAGLEPRCARCGLVVDADFDEIERTRTPLVVLFVAGAVLLALAVPGQRIGNWEALDLTVLGVVVLFTWWAIRGHQRKAVLWREGIILIGRGQGIEVFSWDAVAQARWSERGEVIELLSREGAVVALIDLEQFGTRRRAERFIAAVAHWSQRHEERKSIVEL